MRHLGLLLILICFSGCASSDEQQTMYLPDSTANSTAPGAAFGADGMIVNKPIPTRPDWRPMQFYFKHCSSVDGRAYYSKTSYDCAEQF